MDIDIPSTQEIYYLLTWWAVGELAGKLKPVLLQKVRLMKFFLELIWIWLIFFGIRYAIAIIRVLVVSIIEFGGRYI